LLAARLPLHSRIFQVIKIKDFKKTIMLEKYPQLGIAIRATIQ
jgi:hypothetical protein